MISRETGGVARERERESAVAVYVFIIPSGREDDPGFLDGAARCL